MVSPTGGVPVRFGVVVQLAYAAWQTAGLWRDLTLKKLPRLDCICRQLPTTYQRNGLWCVGLHRRRSGVFSAGVFSWLSLEPVILQRLRSRENYPRHCGHHSAFSSLLRCGL